MQLALLDPELQRITGDSTVGRRLEATLGPPSEKLAERARSAPVEQLEAWLMRIMTADGIEQVFDPS